MTTNASYKGILTTAIARRLRRTMTDAEARLWSRLRNRQLGVSPAVAMTEPGWPPSANNA